MTSAKDERHYQSVIKKENNGIRGEKRIILLLFVCGS